LLVVTAALLVAGGAALAATFTCMANPCTGTENDDTITGTIARNELFALGGVGEVDGGDGHDTLCGGEDNDLTLNGEEEDDKVYGGPGSESDLLSGGPGADNIFTDESPNTDPGMDTVKGDKGNDGIDAADGFKDFIDCGKDKVTNCERRNP
jgi:Ca2+-binding RTX toxin-like protein